LTAGEYCNREVIVVKPGLSVTEAAVLTRRHHVGDLVVVERDGEKKRPVGIITDRDILIEVTAQTIGPGSLTIEDIMSPDPVNVSETFSLMGSEHSFR
jgi:CBS domain-containing protein